MSDSLSLFSVLLLCVVLTGCTAREAMKSPPPRFPEEAARTLIKTPEQCLAETRKHTAYRVNGGWGYDRTSAFTLTVAPGQRQRYYNTVPLENQLVCARNEVEFSETPPVGSRYLVVDQGAISRTISKRADRMYAVWRGQMYLISEKQAPALYQKLAARPLTRRAQSGALSQTRAVPREYWFDITDTFSRGSARQSGKKTASAAPVAPAAWGALP